jgi:hypothetical protein
VAETAAERAEVAAPLAGWVNNAALFRDAALHTRPAGPGHGADRGQPRAGGGGMRGRGAPVPRRGLGRIDRDVSSHQAQRAVRGALP